MNRTRRTRLATLGLLLAAATAKAAERPDLFDGTTDVGDVKHPGSVRYDPAAGEYTVAGSGHNMWADRDAFFYAWKRLSGDLRLTSAVRFPSSDGGEHRKAGWVVRQGLEADAPYADAIVHADGLVSLQYRLVKGGPTLEIRSPVKSPATVRLERTGDLFTLLVARKGQPFQIVGAVLVGLGDPVYVGLGACSHDAERSTTAIFSNVALEGLGTAGAEERVLESTLEVIDIETGERETVYTERGHFEAPNWSRDGSTFFFNRDGRLYALPRTGGTPRPVDTGAARRLNNDHGLSPDGTLLAISHSPADQSVISIVPAAGGEPRQVTALGPSYWHGWSPDGKTLAYCAARNGEYDIYTIAADAAMSKEERRLTTAPGLDDGPDYSPDGRTLYFNSVRTGHMRLWQMNADGSDQRQLTFDEAYGDWFAHPSPDGRFLVFVSFDAAVEGHPPNKEVALRIMPAAGGAPRVLARLFGGQGTINVPSWSPDSRRVAFVSYRLVKPAPFVVPAGAAPDNEAEASFKQLHALVGTWQGTFSNGRSHTVTYKLTAGDSALVETWTLSPTRESMTIYSLDDDALIATHYCPQGNAPTLQLVPSRDKGKLVFEYRGGTNVKMKDKSHQHSFWLRFTAPDSFERSETYVENGASAAEIAKAVEDPPVVYKRVN